MALPQFSMQELIQAGVHFGHKTKRWNPRMAPYLFGVRNDVHIIDLQKTLPLLHKALVAVRNAVANNGRVLFVGTKHQASAPITEAAKRCGQYYVNHRWLGGMLTNWNTIQASIKQLRKLDESLANPALRLTKKEILQMTRDKDKLERSLGGIKDMGGLPSLVFIIDTNREDLAIKEANKLGIPVVAIVDSNSSLEGVDFPIPGNDDATRAIELYCRLFSDAALAGIQQGMSKAGVDLGSMADLPAQSVPNLKAVVANDDQDQGDKASAKKSSAHNKSGKKVEEKAAVEVVKKPSRKIAPKAEETKAEAPVVETAVEEKAAEKKPAAAKKPATAAKKPAAKKK